MAANSGLGRLPGWYHNLRRQPRAVGEIDGARLRLRAEPLPASEAADRWRAVLASAPDYERFTHRTGAVPPIFRLAPDAGAVGPAIRTGRHT